MSLNVLIDEVVSDVGVGLMSSMIEPMYFFCQPFDHTTVDFLFLLRGYLKLSDI